MKNNPITEFFSCIFALGLSVLVILWHIGWILLPIAVLVYLFA